MSASLREQLGARADLDFAIDLPPGWARHAADAATRESMQRDLRARLMQAQRPDLYAQSKAMLADAFLAMEQHRAIAFFAPSEPADDMLMAPGSMIASIRTGEGGATLDAAVGQAIREHGAAPLLGDPRIVRFERERTQELQGQRMTTTSVVYLIPMPGTRRRRAVQLTATFARPADVPGDDIGAVRLRALFDACVATFRWLAPSAA